MDTSKRTLFLAIKGGQSDQIVRKLEADRKSAQASRIKYLKSKGKNVLNLWGSDGGIYALIVKEGKMPLGWRRDSRLERKHCAPKGGMFAVPDGKQKETYKAFRDELRALPSLPGWMQFSNRIGVGCQLHGMSMLFATFERVGDVTVLSIPMRGESSRKQPEFVPPDCKPLKWSEYFEMKEKLEEKKK